MNLVAPTAEEMLAAYKVTELRRLGVSYQKAMLTDSIRIALKNTAIAMRNKQAVNLNGDRQ